MLMKIYAVDFAMIAGFCRPDTDPFAPMLQSSHLIIHAIGQPLGQLIDFPFRSARIGVQLFTCFAYRSSHLASIECEGNVVVVSSDKLVGQF